MPDAAPLVPQHLAIAAPGRALATNGRGLIVHPRGLIAAADGLAIALRLEPEHMATLAVLSGWHHAGAEARAWRAGEELARIVESFRRAT